MSTYNHIEIIPSQCRMARAALQMSVRRLASLSGVAANTVNRFETGRTKATAQTQAAFILVFEENGIELIAEDDGGGAGVRFKIGALEAGD